MEEDSPAGYDDYIYNFWNNGRYFLQAASDMNLDTESAGKIPDYESWDYSGEKHWKWANDPFYANPEKWIDGAPVGYDDYVWDPSLAQRMSMA